MKKTIIILIAVNLLFVMNIGLVEAQEKRITDDFRYGCQNRKYQDKIAQYVARGIKKLLKRHWSQG